MRNNDILSINTITNYPRNTDPILSIEDLKITGYTSTLFKVIFSEVVIAGTVAATKALVNSNQIFAAANVALVGLFVLLKIVNYSLGSKITYKNGDTEEGTFKDNFLVKGKHFFSSNGTILEGIYEKDTLVDGKVTEKNRDTAEGIFKDRWLVKGKQFLSKSDTVKEGIFKNGSLIEGKVTKKNGDTEEGIFKDGQLVTGKKTYTDGRVEVFENGLCTKKIDQ